MANEKQKMINGKSVSCPFVESITVLLPALSTTRRSCPRMKSIVSLAPVQVCDVRVNFGGRNVRVAQQRLHRTRIGAVLHQMSAKALSQCVRRGIMMYCLLALGL